jgi:hypothetical protein
MLSLFVVCRIRSCSAIEFEALFQEKQIDDFLLFISCKSQW